MKQTVKNRIHAKLAQSLGIARLVVILAVAALVLFCAALYPVIQWYRFRADALGCLAALTSSRNQLIEEYLFRADGKNSAEEARHRAEVMELLRVVGLEDVKDDLATSLPYGKQRRLEIARALATEPKLLLLDEPAAGMNPQETGDLTQFIAQIRKDFNVTILLIEHHMDLVMDISDRIYVLDFGRLIAHGTPDEIQKNEKVIDAYLGVVEDAED